MDAPIVVHRPSPSGGRRVTVRGQILGLAHNADVIEFLRRAALPDAESLLDDPRWVEWRGAVRMSTRLPEGPVTRGGRSPLPRIVRQR
ncbi:hypothetical protein GCM10018785_29350 [Streptomyces longispororuber]|uniref:Uncharacterized protein n=1 Tax=Streptomyces longispororuber TaxID=68230 RepID=A0A918ZL08_9ACTN|nr:hypothetical protein GCM10018785_29350 [Streptomyces longispororuber]